MSVYRDQGEGPLVPGRGFSIVRVLDERKALPTLITPRSGETFVVEGASYGRDIGGEWEHLYFENGGKAFFLSTAHIASVVAPETSVTLYEGDSAASRTS